MMPGLLAVKWRIWLGVAIVGFSAASAARRGNEWKPHNSASDDLLNSVSASRRFINKDEGEGMKDEKGTQTTPLLRYQYSSFRLHPSSFPLILQQLPQHVLQNSAIPVIVQLRRRVDAADHLKLTGRALVAHRLDAEFRPDLESVGDAGDVELLESAKPVGLEIFAGLEHQRHDAHADQVAAVNALEALGDNGFDAEQPRPLGGPIARGAGAVFLAGDDDQRHPLFLILHRRVINRHLLFVRQMNRDAALGVRRQLVFEPHV